MDKLEVLKDWLNKSKNIVVFAGAGMSCPSGIPDFRSANGVYFEKFKGYLNPEAIVSHSFFKINPKLFYEFYFKHMVYLDAKPNMCHMYFSKLQETKNISVITQNIDGLDKIAGIKDVIELHGTIWSNHCEKCHKFYELEDIYNKQIPTCSCGGIIKPDVVLYEEALDENKIVSAIKKIQSADMVIVIGTSLVVYPAASFINYYTGDKLVIINKDKTSGDKLADLVINDDIINVIKELQDE